jgi:hypothetical protein
LSASPDRAGEDALGDDDASAASFGDQTAPGARPLVDAPSPWCGARSQRDDCIDAARIEAVER